MNELIKNAINDSKPKAFGKMGNVEASHILTYLNNTPSLIGQQLFVNAGIYADSLDTFVSWCRHYLKSVKNLDSILQWCNEDKLVLSQMGYKGDVQNSFEGIEPFVLGEEGWHYQLKDKTVLCVSPFPDTVQTQVRKFNKIWNGAEIGNLITVKSPYSEALTGEKPKPWIDKLDDMISQINHLDFDFATVGCGGFSLIICDHIKKLGKPCVHLGGGNQILYGIRGKRWDEGFKHHEWYGTKEWIRPLPHETPPRKFYVEGGCYW